MSNYDNNFAAETTGQPIAGWQSTLGNASNWLVAATGGVSNGKSFGPNNGPTGQISVFSGMQPRLETGEADAIELTYIFNGTEGSYAVAPIIGADSSASDFGMVATTNFANGIMLGLFRGLAQFTQVAASWEQGQGAVGQAGDRYTVKLWRVDAGGHTTLYVRTYRNGVESYTTSTAPISGQLPNGALGAGIVGLFAYEATARAARVKFANYTASSGGGGQTWVSADFTTTVNTATTPGVYYKSSTGPAPTKWVLWSHGATQSRESIRTNSYLTPVFNALIAAGYGIIGSDAGGDLWGSDATLSHYRQAVATVDAAGETITHLCVLGMSMGGLAASLLSARGLLETDGYPVDGVWMVCPVLDLYSMNAGTFGAAIRGIYGIANGATEAAFRAAVANHNPVDLAATEWDGLPVAFTHSVDDPVVALTPNTAALRAKITGHAKGNVLYPSTGGHGDDSSQFPSADIIAFFNASIAGTVAPSTGFTTQPATLSKQPGQTATFTVVAVGTGPLTYQWQKNTGSGFAGIDGATAASYTTPALISDDNSAQYRCIVSGPGGVATSAVSVLTVTSEAESGAGSGVRIVRAPLKLTPQNAGPDGTVTCFVGDRFEQRLTLTDANGDPVEIPDGAAVSVLVTSPTGETISGPTTAAVKYADGGIIAYAIAEEDTETADVRVRLTARLSQGSDVHTFGPAILAVQRR